MRAGSCTSVLVMPILLSIRCFIWRVKHLQTLLQGHRVLQQINTLLKLLISSTAKNTLEKPSSKIYSSFYLLFSTGTDVVLSLMSSILLSKLETSLCKGTNITSRSKPGSLG